MDLYSRKSITIFMIVAAIVIILGNITVNPLLRAAHDPNNYHQGFKVGVHDGSKDGVFHHDKEETQDGHRTPWYEGYVDGWSKGCSDSGRDKDNCDSQMDASTQ